jgi:ribosome-binding ATPase YchF (GTP1/OBG family)
MRFAIIGPPQSGKSSLFGAITGERVDPSHAPSERLATVNVPDARLDYLAEIYKPKKYTPHLGLSAFQRQPGRARGPAGFKT